jgi:hypothetical protein
VVELFRRRGYDVVLEGDDAFFACLAHGDRDGIAAFEPDTVERLRGEEPALVTTLASAGNTAAVALALDLGFPLADSALPAAAWRDRAGTVRLLLDYGAPATEQVLLLAERAQTEVSEWTPHRSSEVLELLRARSPRAG